MDDNKCYAGIYPKLNGQGFLAQMRSPDGLVTQQMVPFTVSTLLEHYRKGVSAGEDRQMTKLAFQQATGQTPEDYINNNPSKESNWTSIFKSERIAEPPQTTGQGLALAIP